MTEFIQPAREIAQQMKSITPETPLTVELSGYLLCQGIVYFIEQILEEPSADINFEDFTFEWDNRRAQKETDVLLPLTISRKLASDAQQ